MSEIKNRYEFMFYLSCVDANPNGDPDMDNMPRTIREVNLGYMTGESIKARARRYVNMVHGTEPGMNTFIEYQTNLNRKIAEAKELADVKLADVSIKGIERSRLKACEMFWDIRTFGATMSTGPNGGQVTGPVQIQQARSLDVIQPYNIAITRMASADNIPGAKTVEDYRKAEAEANASKLRTIGRKHFIPYGLYEVRGSIGAYDANMTGFDEKDMQYLFEALANMFEVTRSASKGLMSVVSPIIIFKHVGDPSYPEAVQLHQAMLGRAPAYKLYELVNVAKKKGVEYPQTHHDYTATIDMDGCPTGIDVGFLMPFTNDIIWNTLPEGSDWLKEA